MTHRVLPSLLLAAVLLPAALSAQSSRQADTVRLEVGSPRVDGRYYVPHVGRNTIVRLTGERAETTAAWTNTLTFGDSAGRSVHRWLTSGYSRNQAGASVRFDLWQTFDARTLELLSYHRRSEAGFEAHLTVDRTRIRGTRRRTADGPVEPIDITLPRAGFPAGAADLVPPAVGLREGLVIVMPLWQVGTPNVTEQTWTVRRRSSTEFMGRTVPAWELEVRTATGESGGTIWMIDESPYMVRWDTPGQGSVTRIIGVNVP